jgi:DNA-binding SARP family transcriptional activator
MKVPAELATDHLVMRFLGGFSVQRDSVALDGFGYDKTRALLAYLAVESGGGPHSREKLADLLWPEASAEVARGNLRRTLHDLRKALGSREDLFVAGKHHLGFDRRRAYWLDVDLFSRPVPVADGPAQEAGSITATLEQQLALYRGEFLHGLSVSDAPDFERWVETQREGMRQQALQLLRDLAFQYERQGQPQRAIALLHREIEIDPWNEDAHRRLMQALARSGQTALALAQFESCRGLLQRELGLEPEPQTQALALTIRRGQLPSVAWLKPAATAQKAAQRRQVCVLVCDLQAEQALSGELAADLVIDCHGHCMDIISARGGHGIALQADRILGYFGYPQAQELAPVKALEAALALTEGVAAQVRVRVGAHCGWVVNDQRINLPDVTGQITRHAGALAEQVGWGQAALSPELERLAEGYFELSGLNGADGLPHYLLQARSAASHRLQAAAHRLTPFVGRAAEIRLLRALWERTCQGAGQALLIRAEAGMGKSRLIQMQEAQVAVTGGACGLLRCQPEFQHTPYYPIIDYLQRLLARQREESEEASPGRQLLRWLADLDSALLAHGPVLAELLHLPGEASALPLTPAERRHRVETALLDLLQVLSQRQPLMLVLEDVHWADASTLDWVRASLARPGMSFLLLMSARPEFSPWDGLKTLALPPLPERQAERLIRQITAGAGLDARALKSVLQRTDGIPLYIEEMARTLQSGVPGDIPGTIWNLLAVRLESVGEAGRVAQQAAAIGRDFSWDLLAALWDGEAEGLLKHVAQLTQSGLIHPQGRSSYRFRHALIQDAAYQTLPLGERQRIHGRLARLYQGAFRHLAEGSPERLAQHLAHAGEPIAAAMAWLEAGRLAAERSANQEAVFHFESGLAQLRGRAAPEADTLELSLQAALGNTLIATRGYGAEEAKACFARSLELSRKAADDSALFPVMWGLWLGGRSCTPEAFPLEFADKLARIAQVSALPEHAMQVHYAYGNNLFWMARHDEAFAHLEQAVEIGRSLSSPHLVRTYGEDTGISSRAFQSWIHWIQGRPATALAVAQATVTGARELGHAHTLGFALAFAAVLHRFMRQPQQAAKVGRELLDLANHHDLKLWQAVGAATTGWAAVMQGDPAGLASIEASVAASRQAMLVVEGTFMSFEVDALHRLGRHEACAARAREAIERSEKRVDVYFLSEFLRLRSEALVQQPDATAHAAEASACLRRALTLAREQGAWVLELRAAVLMLQRTAAGAERDALRQRIETILSACPELAVSDEGVAARNEAVAA